MEKDNSVREDSSDDDDSSIDDTHTPTSVEEVTEYNNMSREDLIERLKRLEQNNHTSDHPLPTLVTPRKLIELTSDLGVKDEVLQKFHDVQDVLKDNIRKYTVQTVFPVQKFKQEETILKHLCKLAVQESKVMLPEGCSDSDFAHVFWKEMRDAMNLARQNSNNSARIKYLGKTRQ